MSETNQEQSLTDRMAIQNKRRDNISALDRVFRIKKLNWSISDKLCDFGAIIFPSEDRAYKKYPLIRDVYIGLPDSGEVFIELKGPIIGITSDDEKYGVAVKELMERGYEPFGCEAIFSLRKILTHQFETVDEVKAIQKILYLK